MTIIKISSSVIRKKNNLLVGTFSVLKFVIKKKTFSLFNDGLIIIVMTISNNNYLPLQHV